MAIEFINDPNLPDFRYPTPFMGRGEISCCCSDNELLGLTNNTIFVEEVESK